MLVGNKNDEQKPSERRACGTVLFDKRRVSAMVSEFIWAVWSVVRRLVDYVIRYPTPHRPDFKVFTYQKHIKKTIPC